MYINKIQKAGDYVLISNYTPRFFGAPNRRRERKMRDTPKAMAKYNNQKRAERLQLLILLNFDKGYHITLDYPIGDRPETYEEAENNLKKFLYKTSRSLKRQDKKFKYIAITERGKRREALHHHMIIESDPFVLQEITKIWGNHIKISQMYEEGAYKDLADYFCKIETKEEQTKGKSKYHRSRNLKEPLTRSRIVAGPLKEELVIPKGYEVINDSVVSGYNEIIGIRYQKYMVHKLPVPPRQRPLAEPQRKSEQKGSQRHRIWESIKNMFGKRKKHG